jgi:hypothetical protein
MTFSIQEGRKESTAILSIHESSIEFFSHSIPFSENTSCLLLRGCCYSCILQGLHESLFLKDVLFSYKLFSCPDKLSQFPVFLIFSFLVQTIRTRDLPSRDPLTHLIESSLSTFSLACAIIFLLSF